MKKIFALILSVLLIVTLASCGGKKEEAVTVVDGYLTYTLLKDGTYSVGVTNREQTPDRIDIPSEFNGAKVTAITEDGFAGCTNLRVVSVPDTITRVADGAFYLCPVLETVYLPETITSIGGAAFGIVGIANYGAGPVNNSLTVYYDNTVEAWDNMLLPGNWASKTEITVICTNGVAVE